MYCSIVLKVDTLVHYVSPRVAELWKSTLDQIYNLDIILHVAICKAHLCACLYVLVQEYEKSTYYSHNKLSTHNSLRKYFVGNLVTAALTQYPSAIRLSHCIELLHGNRQKRYRSAPSGGNTVETRPLSRGINYRRIRPYPHNYRGIFGQCVPITAVFQWLPRYYRRPHPHAALYSVLYRMIYPIWRVCQSLICMQRSPVRFPTVVSCRPTAPSSTRRSANISRKCTLKHILTLVQYTNRCS